MVCPLSAVFLKAFSCKSLHSNTVLPEDPICKLHKPTCSPGQEEAERRRLSFAFEPFDDGISTWGVWHTTGVLKMKVTCKHCLPQHLRLISPAFQQLDSQSPFLLSELFAFLPFAVIGGQLFQCGQLHMKSNYRTQSGAEKGWQSNGWDVPMVFQDISKQ